MNKISISRALISIIYFVAVIVISGCLESGDSIPATFTPGPFPTVTPTPKLNSPPAILSVELSTNEIYLPCAHRRNSDSCGKDGGIVQVTVIASDPDNDILTYKYSVNGGRVSGSNEHVQWDLKNSQPGTYTITVGVDDGSDLPSKTETKTVTVRNCPDCAPACMGSISIIKCPATNSLRAGQRAIVEADSGGSTAEIFWSVENGTIKKGQGTTKIEIDTRGRAGKEVVATGQLNEAGTNCGTAVCVFQLKHR